MFLGFFLGTCYRRFLEPYSARFGAERLSNSRFWACGTNSAFCNVLSNGRNWYPLIDSFGFGFVKFGPIGEVH